MKQQLIIRDFVIVLLFVGQFYQSTDWIALSLNGFAVLIWGYIFSNDVFRKDD